MSLHFRATFGFRDGVRVKVGVTVKVGVNVRENVGFEIQANVTFRLIM